MFNVISIKAPRPAVDWFSTAEGVERAPADPLLPADRVSLSPEARGQLARAEAQATAIGRSNGAPGEASARSTQPGAAAEPGEPAQPGAPARSGRAPQAGQATKLSQEEQQRVTELQQRDSHVRSHEAAHQAAGGDLTGPASFSYELGPDGRNYAVGGEVPVQSRAGRTPDETIAIARRVRAAALAPADPSPADLAAAASASQVELRAMQQKRQLGQAGQSGQPAQGGVARTGQAGRTAGASAQAPAATPDAASRATSTGRAVDMAPISTPQANLERLIVRAPEEASPF